MNHNTTGGTFTRYNETPAVIDQANLSTPPSQRVNNGSLRHTAGGELEEVGLARYTATQDGVQGGSVMATLRSDGPTRSVEMIPGVPASRTSIEVALREGVIRQIGPGLYEDSALGKVGDEVLAQGLDQPQVELPGTDQGHEHFDLEDEKLLAEVLEPLPQFAFDAAVASGTLATVRGSDLSGVAKSLAQSTGMEPARALEYCEAVGAHYHRSAMSAVAAAGVPESQHDAFKAFCRENPGQLHEALGLMLHRRDLSGFQQLAVAYKRANPGDLSAWHAAGFETHTGLDGELMIKRGSGDWVYAAELK